MVRLITAVWEKELYLHDLPFAARQLRYVTDRALKRQDALSATLANYLGRHLINRAEYAQAEPYLRQALSIRQRLLGEQVDTAVSMIHLGTLLWKWQSNEAALPYFEEAYQICKNLLGPDHPKTARCLNNLAFLYSRQGNHEKAERFYQETLSIFERTQSMDDVMVPHILVNMALMFQGQGQFAQARDYYERALHLKETVFGIDNYQTAMNQFGLANLMILMGDYQAALPILERSIALRKKLPNGEIILVGPYIRWGELQMIGGQLAEAQTCFEQTLAILNIQPDKPNINWGWLLAKLGQLHRLKGDFAAAETFLQRALLRFAEQPPSYFGNIDVLNQLADLYLQTERLAAAKRVVDDAFAICVQDYGEAHQFTAQVRLRWGEWRQLQGDEEGARVIFEEAEGVLKTAVAPTHIDYIRVQEHL